MPKIRQYTSQVNAAGPTSSRQYPIEDSGFSVGVERLGRGVAEAGDLLEKRAQQADISDLHKKLSDLHIETTTALKDTLRTADPGNTDLTQDFIDDFDDKVADLSEKVTTSAGRQFFDKITSEYRTHFLEKAYEGQSALAGIKAKADYDVALNNYSSSLLQDPSSFDEVRQIHQTALEDFVNSHGLPREDAIKLQENGDKKLAKAAIQGWISNNPEYADQQIKSGRFDQYIDSDVKHQLLGEVVQAQHARDAEAERQKRKQQELLGQQQMQTQNDFLQKLTTGDLTNKDILNSNLDPFGSGSKEQFIKLLEAGNQHQLKTDPGTFSTLFERIHLPDGDPKKLVDENELNQYVVDGLLSFDDLNKLRAEKQGMRTEQGKNDYAAKQGIINKAKAIILQPDPLTKMVDPERQENYRIFLSMFNDEWDKQRKAGKSVRDLTDPGSKDDLGKMVDQFRQSLDERMRSQFNSLQRQTAPAAPTQVPNPQLLQQGNTPAPAPNSSDMMRRPGETILQWRERTRGK